MFGENSAPGCVDRFENCKITGRWEYHGAVVSLEQFGHWPVGMLPHSANHSPSCARLLAFAVVSNIVARHKCKKGRHSRWPDQNFLQVALFCQLPDDAAHGQKVYPG